ncbi:DUF2848 domain-containing protein [Telmatospirillum siberiense]|uniref:DUF2848 domain-containing protein n=1 Tax=Telmatospirillum siberiense TaxID=382514 RepID=A0A2N3PQM9_9PROT|nr:DUF2848 domain-containing protein [Telmatospirillum siberiense]PKU22710.1 DUF2848 domain-containing protein [Telmatospirillum siberiense]
MPSSLPLDLILAVPGGETESLRFFPERLVIAGWAGRDQEAVRHHIEELQAIGVPPPSATPLFYAGSPALLTTDETVAMLGPQTSGEVEPVLVATARGLCVGVGSDHTDRYAEEWSVAHAKQLCAKPIGTTLWRLADVIGHWDALILRSFVGEAGSDQWTPYQEGTMEALRRPEDLLDRLGGLPEGGVMFGGTIPAIGGIRPAFRFRMEIEDPVLGRRIGHSYVINDLPVVA